MATENIRINYEVDKKQLDASNKALQKTAELNDLTQKEVEQTNEKFGDQEKQLSKTNKAFSGLSGQLTAIGNRFQIAGKGAGDMASGLFKTATGAGTATKAMKILKIAIASTGIGALVVALGSLVTFFTKTQRGADIVSKAMAAIGATVDVVIDRVSTLGEGFFKILRGDFSGGLKLLKSSFAGLGEEIRNEANAALELDERLQSLRKAEIALSVEVSKRRAEIKSLNKDAEDTTLGIERQQRAAAGAIRIEKELQAERVRIAAERVDIIRKQNALGESLIEDDERLAEAEIALNNIRMESDEMLTTLNNKYNILTNSLKALNQETLGNEEEEIIERVEARLDAEILFEDEKLKIIEDANANLLKVKESAAEEEMRLDAMVVDNKDELAKQGLSGVEAIAGRQSALGKAAAFAQASINVAEGVTKALAAAPPPFNLILAGITGGAGAIQLQAIASTTPKFEKGGRIGGNLHSQGGTLIEAERDEFVMSRKATNKYGFDFMEKLNSLEVNDAIINGTKRVNVVDTKPIAEQLSKMPHNIINIDSHGFEIHQKRGQDRISQKLNRYST